jgi:phosphatidylserine decarboxylase
MKDRLFVLLQYPLPHHLLSRIVRGLTRLPLGPLLRPLLVLFVRHFRVDLDEAADSSLASYPTFNRFFTRALRPSARPIVGGESQIACPVDGTVSQAGAIESNRLFQAKGHDYTLEALLGGDTALAKEFISGAFATIYLSPRDYHRIHMPEGGRLRRMVYVPGRLFSVNAVTTRQVPGLFARNERLVCVFDTAHGPMAVILVGALFVGSMETVWDGPAERTAWRAQAVSTLAPGVKVADCLESGKNVVLKRGDELGRFNMGSTVILLFAERAMRLDAAIRAERPVKLGQLLGEWTGAAPASR